MIGIHDLPNPNPALVGWPWTEESASLPASLSGQRQWPRISVVTPSLNQAEFLEQTIRSVLLQRYPNLEYIIIDGGSTDGSVEIISRYAQQLAYHVSEPDRGYVHAINKGLECATGEIICWLNSDDFYLPGTLQTVAENFASDKTRAAIVGHILKVYTDGRPSQKFIGRYASLNRLLRFWLGYQMHQPSIFWRREVFDAIGYLDEERDLIADFDYWVRIARHFQFSNVDQILSCATDHPRAKTADGCVRYHEELRNQATTYWGSPFLPRYWFLTMSMFFYFHIRKPLQPAINVCRCHCRPIKYRVALWTMRKRTNA